ncbi:MAG TPA: phosphopantetheine-binding protein, partial [Thermoanaerobaculia bacterium]|nr:phosphopantetheine-binding protein [Thermoanaerobaculia bacterium]
MLESANIEEAPAAGDGDGLAQGFAPPRTPLEQRLVALWSEVLGVERIGRQDNFFALGGHSLLAGRLLSRLRDAFGTDLPLSALFAAPTVAGLAAAIAAARTLGAATAGAGGNGSNGRLRGAPAPDASYPGGHCPPAPLQLGIWLADRAAPGEPLFH